MVWSEASSFKKKRDFAAETGAKLVRDLTNVWDVDALALTTVTASVYKNSDRVRTIEMRDKP